MSSRAGRGKVAPLGPPRARLKRSSAVPSVYAVVPRRQLLLACSALAAVGLTLVAARLANGAESAPRRGRASVKSTRPRAVPGPAAVAVSPSPAEAGLEPARLAPVDAGTAAELEALRHEQAEVALALVRVESEVARLANQLSELRATAERAELSRERRVGWLAEAEDSLDRAAPLLVQGSFDARYPIQRADWFAGSAAAEARDLGGAEADFAERAGTETRAALDALARRDFYEAMRQVDAAQYDVTTALQAARTRPQPNAGKGGSR